MLKNPLKGSYVSLYSWGTHPDGGNGMTHFLDAAFFGGNVGHASIGVTFPADETGKALIQKYCYRNDEKIIPFEIKLQNTLDDNNQVVQQEVFTVYFSWWPPDDASEKKSYRLRIDINHDNGLERLGVDVGPLNPRFSDPLETKDPLQPLEERVYGGIFGSKEMTLSPQSIIHNTTINEAQLYFLDLDRRLEAENAKLGVITIIQKKLQLNEQKLLFTVGLTKLLDAHIPGWRAIVSNEKDPSSEDMEKLKEKLIETWKEYEASKSKIQQERNRYINELRIPFEQALRDEAERLREVVGSLSLADSESMRYDQNLSRFSKLAWIEYDLQNSEQLFKNASVLAVFTKTFSDFEKDKSYILPLLFDETPPEQLKSFKDGLENWRDLMPEKYKNVTRGEMNDEIYKAFIDNVLKTNKVVKEQRNKILFEKELACKFSDPFLKLDYEQFLTFGLPPDNEVTLPVSGIQEDDNIRPGLNIEKMLQKMNEYAQPDSKFDIKTNNCSVVTCKILASGSAPELQGYLNKKAWGGGFGTPQQVLNGALKYQNVVVHNDGKKPFLDKLANLNPLNAIEWAGGSVLKALAKPDNSIILKIGLGIVGIPLGILVGALQTVKAIANPKKTFVRCARFINYAWKNNSALFKIASLPVALIAGVASVPAALQFVVSRGIIRPIVKLFNYLSKERRKSAVKEDIMNGTSLNLDRVKEISEQDAAQAIIQLSTILKENPDKIPVLSSQSQVIVSSYLNAMSRNDPRVIEYNQIVDEIFKRVKRH